MKVLLTMVTLTGFDVRTADVTEYPGTPTTVLSRTVKEDRSAPIQKVTLPAVNELFSTLKLPPFTCITNWVAPRVLLCT